MTIYEVESQSHCIFMIYVMYSLIRCFMGGCVFIVVRATMVTDVVFRSLLNNTFYRIKQGRFHYFSSKCIGMNVAIYSEPFRDRFRNVHCIRIYVCPSHYLFIDCTFYSASNIFLPRKTNYLLNTL